MKQWRRINGGQRFLLGVGVGGTGAGEVGKCCCQDEAFDIQPTWRLSLYILWPGINWCTYNTHLICLITICSHPHHRALLQMIPQPSPLGGGWNVTLQCFVEKICIEHLPHQIINWLLGRHWFPRLCLITIHVKVKHLPVVRGGTC